MTTHNLPRINGRARLLDNHFLLGPSTRILEETMFALAASSQLLACPSSLSSCTETETGSKLLPAFFYGTAWKGERTTDLVFQALEAGFIAIDTAAQPRHYREELVGEALRETLKRGVSRTEDIFVACATGTLSRM